MVCVQCGTENPEHAKYCSKCSALLFQVAPEGLPPSSSIDLDEEIEYPVATAHYQSPILEQLAWAVHEFAEEEGDLEPVVEAYEAFREIYEGFRKEIPVLQELHYASEGFIEGDPTPKYVKYLLNRSIEYYAEGETHFEGYLEGLESLAEDEDFPDPRPLMEGTKSWLNCNDNICMTFELLTGQMQALTMLLDDYDERVARGEDVSAEAAEAEAALAEDEEAVEEGAEA
jgi:hypothetical protein